MTVTASTGFVYAAAVMGVTGARDTVGADAAGLVERTRAHTDLPIGVGIGVRSGDQAAELAGFADAVIVGSAFVSKAADGVGPVRTLAAELAEGVRRPLVAS
jgi:tryptophan synthase alpha chain